MAWGETLEQNHRTFSMFPLEVVPSFFFKVSDRLQVKGLEKGLKVGYKFLEFIPDFTDMLSK